MKAAVRALVLEPDALTSVVDHMGTLADPLRCRVLLVLERQELTVSELCAILQLPQSTVSRHLKTLADAGWVASRRDGTSRFYGTDLDALDSGARRLWPLVREQVSGGAGAAQDARRLASVLARRRSTSEAFFATASGQWDRLRADLFGETFHLHALLGLLDPDAVVADLGCGTGALSSLLAPHVRRVVAVDGSPDMLTAARRRLRQHANVDVRLGTLEQLPLEGASLDIAIMALVLHHVPDPARALSECARVLKVGGRALVIDMLPHDRAEYRHQMGHVWLGFSESQMRKLLSAAEFGQVRIHPLPIDADVKGPAVFVASARRNEERRTKD
jgi:ArsR family transcriptional regulator